MSRPTTGYHHAVLAEECLERADRIANADHWSDESRTADVANKLAEAQVHATLAIADRVDAVVYVMNGGASI